MTKPHKSSTKIINHSAQGLQNRENRYQLGCIDDGKFSVPDKRNTFELLGRGEDKNHTLIQTPLI